MDKENKKLFPAVNLEARRNYLLSRKYRISESMVRIKNRTPEERDEYHRNRLEELKRSIEVYSCSGAIISREIFSESEGKHLPEDPSPLVARLSGVQSACESILEQYGCSGDLLKEAVEQIGRVHSCWVQRFLGNGSDYISFSLMVLKYPYYKSAPELDGRSFAADLLDADDQGNDKSVSEALAPFDDWDNGPVFLAAALWYVDMADRLRKTGRLEHAACAAIGANELLSIANFYLEDDFPEEGLDKIESAVLTAAAELGKRGADKRHAKNREIKEQAIALYAARNWPSRAEAVRRIAPQVNRDPTTIKGWFERFDRERSGS